jgi:hypothetical protein
MAREAGFNVGDQFTGGTVADIKRFEALVRADERSVEREACAKVADRYVGADPIADAIRARGETK